MPQSVILSWDEYQKFRDENDELYARIEQLEKELDISQYVVTALKQAQIKYNTAYGTVSGGGAGGSSNVAVGTVAYRTSNGRWADTR